jgi:5-methylcytosine-specific restriction endonuclease McrA
VAKACASCGGRVERLGNRATRCKACQGEVRRLAQIEKYQRRKEAGKVDAYKEANKDAIQQATRQRYLAKRGEKIAYAKQYREQNREAVRQALKDWRAKNRVHVAKYNAGYMRTYKSRDPARWKAYGAQYRAEHGPRLRERARSRHARNKEQLNAVSRQWYYANRPRAKENAHTRRARVRGNGGRLSYGITKKLYMKQEGRCACCGESLTDGYHLDHIMPIALGGTNTDDNVQLLTPRCNLQKGAKHPDTFMRTRRAQHG